MRRKRQSGHRGKKAPARMKVKITKAWPTRRELKEEFRLTDEQIRRMRGEVREAKALKEANRDVLWKRYVRALMEVPLSKPPLGHLGAES